jgi:hypothetical protein
MWSLTPVSFIASALDPTGAKERYQEAIGGASKKVAAFLT